jgi:phosphotriesterase-related protein
MMHEHFCLRWADRTVLPRLIAQIEDVKRYGVRTIVDATAADMPRDPALAVELSKVTGVNFVVATGLYWEHEAVADAFGFKRRSRDEDLTNDMVDLFVKEIETGIGDSGIKAGIIKVATGPGRISAYEGMALAAAARAQQRTGVAITTHTDRGTMAPEQAARLIAAGADPSRVIIGHMDGNTSLDYQLAVLAHGVYVSFDRFGAEHPIEDAAREQLIVDLVGKGYAQQIIISQDWAPSWFRMPGVTASEPVALPQSRTHDRIFANTLPSLERAGLTGAQLRGLTMDNPRRVFDGAS